MKTLQDLYKEVMASEELKKAFAQAAKDNKVSDFLKAQGCDATEDEFKAFLTEKAKTDKALSEEDLENVAGGLFVTGGGDLYNYTGGDGAYVFTTAEPACDLLRNIKAGKQ